MDVELIKRKRGYLDYLQNKYGKFQVCILNTNDKGERYSSKWHDWMEVRELDWFVEKINNRTVLRCEIILDFDELKYHSPWYELKDQQYFKGLAQSIYTKVHKENNVCVSTKLFLYSANGRANHGHIIAPQLSLMNKINRETYRKTILSKCGIIDSMKYSEKSMIALELFKHWKTGAIKELVYKISLKKLLD